MSKSARGAFWAGRGGGGVKALGWSRLDRDAETRILRARLRQANRQMVLLNRVSAILSDSRNLNAVLEGVAREVSKSFGFNAMRMFLHDRRRDRFILKASFSADPEKWSGVRSFKRGQGNVGRVGETGKAVTFEDIQNDPEYGKLSRTRKSRKGGYRFFGAFPIKSRLATVGVVVCIGDMPRRLRPSEEQLIGSIANQIAVAFENACLIEDARAKADEFSALYSISTIINESPDLDQVLRKVMYRLMEIFGADAARVYFLDENENELRLRACEGVPRELHVLDRYRPGEGITGKVFESGTPCLFGNALTSRKFQRFSNLRLGLRHIYRKQLYIPISVKNQTLGVMNFLTKAPRPFTSTETQLIRTIANHLGMAFENLSLFNKSERQARELGSLAKINRDIASLLDCNTLLPRIAEEAKSILNVDVAHFRLLVDGALVLASASYPVPYGFLSTLKLGESLSGIVATSRRVLAVKDALTDPRLVAAHRRLYRQMGWRSYLGVPMVVGNRVTGVLCCVSKTERSFSPKELEIIGSFADEAAIAVENAKLFAEVKDKVAELESLNHELQAAHRIKSEFMESVSHELRTPLTAIIGYTSLLADGYGGGVNEMQRELLESVGHNSEMLLSLINNVLMLASLDAKKMPVQINRVPLEDILHHLRMYTTHLNIRPDLEVVWDVGEDLPLVVTDQEKLEEILQNLINNAYKFTPRGRITIRVRDLQRQCRLEFSVADTGIGIEDLNRVFDRFHQGPRAHLGELRGMGLGLSIVKEFLALIEGELRVASEPGKGSNFTFTIPYSIQQH